MACLRSAEPVREFVSAVTSTEAAAGIYTLIRNSVQIYTDCYTDQCRSQCACFAFARRACWPCQQDSCNKITKNIEIHLRTHFTLFFFRSGAPQVLLLYRIAIYAVPSSFLQYAVLSDFSSERCQSKQL